MPEAVAGRRGLFVLTILVGSFLLFLVQPMVARMALPRLGGAPNVWNSAMLVYQALLLGGYAYAHWLGKLPLRRQAKVHLGLLAVAAVTLPIQLADLPPVSPGWEALWVPALLAVSVGPVFFLVSAQAPLMQRWYAADPRAGEPWALYAASNLGSFAGLIAYPLAVEPVFSLSVQGWAWAAGYAVLIALVALSARARWRAADVTTAVVEGPDSAAERIAPSRIGLWLLLSAVPSGLMLSTTTHLTTDIFAMPLLWVIPLGLYLLSFVVAFSDRRGLAGTIIMVAPLFVLLAGGMAMVSRHSTSMMLVVLSVMLLFVICVALHARLYDSRPHASQLTLFYFVMSAGGALGGLFTALIAPLVFDWVWEHPILVFAAALLLPRVPWLDWRRLAGLEPGMVRLLAAVAGAVVLWLCWMLWDETSLAEPGPARLWLSLGAAWVAMLLVPWRWAYAAMLAAIMLAQGGVETARDTMEGLRTRSYFGIYTVRDYPEAKLRTLAHGTTLHGEQLLDPQLRTMPISYYGPGSGIAIALTNAPRFYGPDASIGVVGLGTGTLACYAQPGERWHFYEIDPAVLEYSRNRTFTYLADCTPKARVVIGDARLELARAPKGSFDVLAIDAFSSDSIPLHLLTKEAFGVYLDALGRDGLLVVHISNRFIELEPAIAALARHHGLALAIRDDVPTEGVRLTGSSWVILTRDPARLDALRKLAPDKPMRDLLPPAPRAWSDNHASILPYIRWENLLGKP